MNADKKKYLEIPNRVVSADNPDRLTDRLKLIVVVGYENTGKSLVIRRVFSRLCCLLDGSDVKSNQYWGRVDIGQGRMARLYCGEDGDAANCVEANLYDIAKRNYGGCSSPPYDYAIIGLRRTDYDKRSDPWTTWIGNAIENIRNGVNHPALPNAFQNLDVYYVHTAWPVYSPVGTQAGDTEVAKPESLTIPTIDDLSDWCADQVIALLKKTW